MIKVQTKSYSGPMDLLLDLVKEAKLNIYDIEISSITEQFLEAMQEISISPDELSDFIRMASILVLMKIRYLVKDSQEDEEDDLPSREELIDRLWQYKTFKSLRPFFQAKEKEGEKIFRKLPEDLSIYAQEEEPLEGDPDQLFHALDDLLDRKEEDRQDRFEYQTIVNIEEYSLKEISESIRQKLLTGRHFSFQDLLTDRPLSKARLIVSFLSLLELTKFQTLELKQEDREIEIEVVDREGLKALDGEWKEDLIEEGREGPDQVLADKTKNGS